MLDELEPLPRSINASADTARCGSDAIRSINASNRDDSLTRTESANEAQVAEFRRLVNELGWGSKVALDWMDSILGLGVEIPADGRVARSTLSGLLEKMSAENIGTLIQKLHAEKEQYSAPQVVTP